MTYMGELAGLSRDFRTGKPVVQFQVFGDPEPLNELAGKQLRIDVKEMKSKRSLDANSYYWALLTKLGDKLRLSKAYLHNLMIRRYGQPEIIGGKIVYVVIRDTDEAQKQAEEDEHNHLRPTSEVKVGNDGIPYRTYILMRGSHQYNSKEMSVLIDGLVSECKEHNIETLTPEELARLR